MEHLAVVEGEGADAGRLLGRVVLVGEFVGGPLGLLLGGERHVEVGVEGARRGREPGEGPAHAFLVGGELGERRPGHADEGDVALGEVHAEALVGVGPERAARAALIPVGPVHEVVHEELASPVEQLDEALRPGWPVEAVLLVNPHPRQRPPLRGELVATAVEILLPGEEVEASGQPLGR